MELVRVFAASHTSGCCCLPLFSLSHNLVLASRTNQPIPTSSHAPYPCVPTLACLLLLVQRVALLEAQLRQAELVARVERDTVRRSETLLTAAREEADTMQGALMVAAAEMERFAGAVRSRYGTVALDSLLASAVISNEAFARGGGGPGAGAGSGSGAGSGASRAAASSGFRGGLNASTRAGPSYAAAAAAAPRSRPIAEDYAGEGEGDGEGGEADLDGLGDRDSLGDGFVAEGAATASAAAAPSGKAASPAVASARLATVEHASDDATSASSDAHAAASAGADAGGAASTGIIRPPVGPRAGLTGAATSHAVAAAVFMSAAGAAAGGSGAASVSGSSVSSRKTGQTSRSGHTGHTGSHAGSRASGGRSRLPTTRIVIGADGSAILTSGIGR